MSSESDWAEALCKVMAERDRLKALLRQCADELAVEIEAKYPPYMLEYPHERQKKKNDMEIVLMAREALE